LELPKNNEETEVHKQNLYLTTHVINPTVCKAHPFLYVKGFLQGRMNGGGRERRWITLTIWIHSTGISKELKKMAKTG